MKVLPTAYNGTTFRSRLEADWAMTLDDRRLDWQYEPEGYELSDGTWYSPDFWLPGPKAWLEVKGSHMLGVSKVEQFAADLWAASGAADTYDRRAPMVLLGQEPRRWQHEGDPDTEHMRLMGVRGQGLRNSVAIVRCPSCTQATVIALWQPWCRTCGEAVGEEPGYDDKASFAAWVEDVFDSLRRPFLRVQRPAGKGRRP